MVHPKMVHAQPQLLAPHTWFQLERESLYSLMGQLSPMVSSCRHWVGSQIGAQQAILTPGWYQQPMVV